VEASSPRLSQQTERRELPREKKKEGDDERIEEDKDEEEHEDEDKEAEAEDGTKIFSKNNGLFSCPCQGCVSTFQKHSSLEYHILYGKCKLLEEKHTLLDKAKILYSQKLSEGTSAHPLLSSSTASTSCAVHTSQGWALKQTKKSARFNDNQKRYLEEKFRLGQETGHKADPSQVAHDLRHAKYDNGERRFGVSEFLTPQQVQSYFSRTAAKLRQTVADNEIDVQTIDDTTAYSFARNQIIQECQLSHPIIYDTYNLCQLCTTNKLKRLSVALLRCMCTYFHMEVDSLPVKRKAPYIDLLNDLVKSCSCSENM